MKTIKMSKLKVSCNKKRAFSVETNSEVADFVIHSKICTNACRDLILGRTSADVQSEFHDGFSQLYYPTEETRRVEEELAWKLILRYVNGELLMYGRRVVGRPIAVDIGLSAPILVEPDYIRVSPAPADLVDYEGIIHVYKLHAGNAPAATVTKTDLTFYAMIKYARELVSPGKRCLIVASHVYLKRKDDRYAGEKPHFENDFFANGGNNVLSVSEVYVGGSTAVTEIDLLFEDAVKDYAAGVEAEECSESDCKSCELYALCHYAEPPIKKEKEMSQKQLRSLMLTSAQSEAIEYEKGIVRINAGAGVGKTMVVALRTATLLTKGVKPENILLITFTNSGAEEMRARIKAYNEDFGTGEDISKMKICTFNAFGDDIIKEEYARFGFSEPPTIIDNVERAGIISKLLAKNAIAGLDYKNFTINSQYVKGALWIASRVFEIIKKGPYGFGDENKIWDALGADCRFITSHAAITNLINLYDEFDAELRENNLIEFTDQEMMVFEILQQDPYYLEKFGFTHIIVDEFQDTSFQQIELIKKLIAAPFFESLMVVGDDAQAIFSFRDTTPEYIINFSKYIGESTDDINLLENHRCTPEIIAFANTINDKNTVKVAKHLIATRPNGAPVVVKGFQTVDDEQQYIVDTIKEKIAAGTPPEDIAIICATKKELRKFANMLTKENIQSVSLNPEPLVENSRVQAAIGFIKSLSNPTNTQGLLVYANAKAGGVVFSKTETEIQQMLDDAKNDLEIVNEKQQDEKKEILMDILTQIDHNNDEIYQAFLNILKRKPFEKIVDYCDDFVLYGESNEARREHNYPGVVLTTSHSSKGLEWPIVFASVTGFDTERKMVRNSRTNREETRRLLFVTATRARDELYVTGKYVAYGKKGAYIYNLYLHDAYDAIGKDFNILDIQAEAEQLAEKRKKERLEARNKMIEEMAAKKRAVGLI